MIDKKKLRSQYEERLMTMGVYALKADDESFCYIGSSNDLVRTKTSIFFRLSVGALASYPEIQTYYEKHGESSLIYTVVDVLDQKCEKEEQERQVHLMKKLYLEENSNAKEIRV